MREHRRAALCAKDTDIEQRQARPVHRAGLHLRRREGSLHLPGRRASDERACPIRPPRRCRPISASDRLLHLSSQTQVYPRQAEAEPPGAGPFAFFTSQRLRASSLSVMPGTTVATTTPVARSANWSRTRNPAALLPLIIAAVLASERATSNSWIRRFAIPRSSRSISTACDRMSIAMTVIGSVVVTA